jgi:hypothetical protein
MDPLSISASIAGLVSLLGSLIAQASKYASDLRDANKTLTDFIQDLVYLKGVLTGFEAYIKVRSDLGPERSPLVTGLSRPSGAIKDCNQAIRSMIEWSGKCERNPGQRQRKLKLSLFMRGLLTWPLTKDATDGHLRRIERLKCTFILALSDDNL